MVVIINLSGRSPAEVRRLMRENPSAVFTSSPKSFARRVRLEKRRLEIKAAEKKAAELAKQELLRQMEEQRLAEEQAKALAETQAKEKAVRLAAKAKKEKEEERIQKAKLLAKREKITIYEALAKEPVPKDYTPDEPEEVIYKPYAPVPPPSPQETKPVTVTPKAPSPTVTKEVTPIEKMLPPKPKTRAEHTTATVEKQLAKRKGVERVAAEVFVGAAVTPAIGAVKLIETPKEALKDVWGVVSKPHLIIPSMVEEAVTRPARFVGGTIAATASFKAVGVVGSGAKRLVTKTPEAKFDIKVKKMEAKFKTPYEPSVGYQVTKDIAGYEVKELQYALKPSEVSFFAKKPAVEVKPVSAFYDVKKVPGYVKPEVAPEFTAIKQRFETRGKFVETIRTTPPLQTYDPYMGVKRLLTEQRPARRFDYPGVAEYYEPDFVLRQPVPPKTFQTKLRGPQIEVTYKPKLLTGIPSRTALPVGAYPYKPSIELTKVKGVYRYEPPKWYEKFMFADIGAGAALYGGTEVVKGVVKVYTRYKPTFTAVGKGLFKEAKDIGVRLKERPLIGERAKVVPGIKALSEQDIYVSTAQRLRAGITPAIIPKSITEVTPEVDTSVSLAQRIVPVQEVSVMQDVMQKQVQEQRQRLVPALALASSVVPEITPKIPKPTIRPKPKPRPPVWPVWRPSPELDDEEREDFFDVFVRRGGKFLLAAGGFAFPAAGRRAFTELKAGAAASAKVVRAGAGPTGKGVLPSLRLGFRESKVTPGVVVQKRAYRIGTPGEKREITYKGIQASRIKRLSK